MIYDEDTLNQIVGRTLNETLQYNYSIEGYRVDMESMRMLILPALRRGVTYIKECAEEEYVWKDKHDALVKKMSNKDFSHAQQNIRENQKRDLIEKENMDMKKSLEEKDARIKYLEEKLAKFEDASPNEPPAEDGGTGEGESQNNPSDTIEIPRSQYDWFQSTIKKYQEKEARGPATSNNSSLPPSKNPIGHKHKHSTRQKSGKKPGGEIGHTGSSHNLSSNPDEIVQHFPKTCPECGREIDPSELELQARRQQAHWPIMHISITEHQLLAGTCKCGCHITGEFPEGVNAPFSFSNSCLANLAYMSTFLTTPYKRLAEFLTYSLGISISPATIVNAIKKVSESLGPYLSSLRETVSHAEANCLDETALKVKVDKENFWIWANVALDILGNCFGIYMELCDDRKHENIEKICPGKKAKNIVHDRKADYFNPDYIDCENHQVCLIHLKRDSQAIIEAVPESDWAKKFQDVLNRIFDMKKAWEDPEAPPDITNLEKDMDNLFNERPDLKDKEHQETVDKFILAMEKIRPHMLTCLKVYAVPPTNNPAETSFRMTKCKQNVSGCFRSVKGADDYVRIYCAVQNQRIKGENPVNILKTALDEFGKASKTK